MEFGFLNNQSDQRKKQGLLATAQRPKTFSNPFNKSNAFNLGSTATQKPANAFQKAAAAFKAKANFQPDDDEGDAIKNLLKNSEQRYQLKLAEETSKVVAEDPLAYQYDTLYDDMKARTDTDREQKQPEKKSRYIKDLLQANEKRLREQTAAWERMEKKERQREVDQGLASGQTESFVTSAYLKQMELSKEDQAVTELEEKLNEQKTANAQTGMMGFYKNFLTKNRDIGGGLRTEEAPEETVVDPPKNTRSKIEDTLKAMKEKQEQLKRQQEQDRLNEQYDDDPFKLKKTQQPTQPELQSNNKDQHLKTEDRQAKRKSRSRSKSPRAMKTETSKPDKTIQEDKVKALRERYLKRKLEQTNQVDNSDGAQ